MEQTHEQRQFRSGDRMTGWPKEIPLEQLPEGTRRRIRRHRHATKRTVYEACYGSYLVWPHGQGYRLLWASTPEARLAQLNEGWQGVLEVHSPRISDAIFLDLFAPTTAH